MTKEMYEKILDYRTAMIVASDLLKKGIISEKEYNKIDTNIAKRYGVSSSSIFR